METVKAILSIAMNIDCPECGASIDLLDESETNGTYHDEEGGLLRQMFPDGGDHETFECDEVVCTECKTEFNVKGLEW